MAIKACGHRLTLRPNSVEDSEAAKTKAMADKAGLVLPEKAREELDKERLREQAGVDQGIVLTIGPTAFRDFGGEPWCNIGDHVAYARHAGKWVKDPETDEDILVLNDEDIVCIIINNKEVSKDD